MCSKSANTPKPQRLKSLFFRASHVGAETPNPSKTLYEAAAMLLVVVAVFTCGEARATSLRRMSVAEMSRAAGVIVRAKAAGESTRWDAGEIWTFTTFDVKEVWKGAAAQQIVVRLLGGRTAEFTSTVAGVPRFRAGEEVILFLEQTKRGDYSITSWMQGTFRVVRDAATGQERVQQDTAIFPVFDPATRSFAASGIRNLAISELRAQVAAALRSENGSRK